MADDHIRAQDIRITPPPSPTAPLSDRHPIKVPNLMHQQKGTERPAGHPPKDAVREVIETIVFVVVLVLLLKTFIAEAFVIPTGSMATTLWGYQKVVTCPQCEFTFPVNCSSEVDPQQEHRKQPVTGCICPNCRYDIDFTWDQDGIVAHLDVQRAEDGSFTTAYLFLDNVEEVKRAFAFELTPQTRVTVDGQVQTIADIPRRGRARVVFKQERTHDAPLGPQRVPCHLATNVEVVTSGRPSKEPAVFDPPWHTGDRVLVAKFLYQSSLRPPRRQDVVVFKFPGDRADHETGPQRDHVAINYIKRLIGLPGETVGIYFGNIYVADGLHPGNQGTPAELRQPEFMLRDEDTQQLKLDAIRPRNDSKRSFRIVQKSPEHLLALSRIVFDNRYQAKDLAGKVPPRWVSTSAGAWKLDSSTQPRTFTRDAGSDNLAWLRYYHRIPMEETRSTNMVRVQDQLITDFMGYNSQENGGHAGSQTGFNWVGDLILECTAEVQTADGELRLQLSKGLDRFEARFNLQNGECTLVRLTQSGNAVTETVLDRKPTSMKQPGKYQIRFANVDEMLTLWVDSELPFTHQEGDQEVYGVSYDPPGWLGPTDWDLEPVGIAVRGGGVTVSDLVLSRDTYYTAESTRVADLNLSEQDRTDYKLFRSRFGEMPAKTLFVQPGHYLCMGDNSTQSSDSRKWGTVPEDLLLGRALVIYFPFRPFSPESRVGLIE